MEQINATEAIRRHRSHDEILGYLLINAMTEYSQGKDIREVFGMNNSNIPGSDVWLGVTLTINGVECSLSHFAKCLDGQLERIIKEEAERMVKDKLDELSSAVDDVVASLKANLGLRECTCRHYE